jgi:hypothetical protein
MEYQTHGLAIVSFLCYASPENALSGIFLFVWFQCLLSEAFSRSMKHTSSLWSLSHQDMIPALLNAPIMLVPVAAF